MSKNPSILTNSEPPPSDAKEPSPEIPAEGMRLPKRDPPPASGFGDNFDPAKFRLNQDFLGAIGVKKVLTGVGIQRPNPQDFFRVKKDPGLPFPTLVLELKQEREIY